MCMKDWGQLVVILASICVALLLGGMQEPGEIERMVETAGRLVVGVALVVGVYKGGMAAVDRFLPGPRVQRGVMPPE